MRKFLFPSAVALVIFSGSARADDWSGFYAGVHAGYGWGDDNQKLVGTDANGSEVVQDFRDIGAATSFSLDGGSALGGAQVGFNFLSGSFLWGVEADISRLNISERGADTVYYVDDDGFGDVEEAKFDNSADGKLDWLGTVRLRVGTLLDARSLVYVTGGLVYARTKGAWNFTFTDIDDGEEPYTAFSASNESWSAGWTLGGGAEFIVADGVSLRGEYLYYDLGDTSSTVRIHEDIEDPIGLKLKSENTGHSVRAALNFQIGE